MRKEETHFNFIIADDDQEDQQLLLQAFGDSFQNYSPVSVYNGRELMDYLLKRSAYADDAQSTPDFIFLDINMPEKNGYEALKELKSINKLQNIPVYIFSTTCSMSDQKLLLKLGAEKCYIKPSEYRGYKEIITEVMIRTKMNSPAKALSYLRSGKRELKLRMPLRIAY
jgi:CheY-like chemotaxis protein